MENIRYHTWDSRVVRPQIAMGWIYKAAPGDTQRQRFAVRSPLRTYLNQLFVTFEGHRLNVSIR